MNKKDNKKSKKIKKMLAICSLSSLVFIVATYAWFIGMQSVSVSSFEIEIASTDGLLLSLDGNRWDTTVTINNSNYTSVSYEGNVNNWAGYGTSKSGLKPISSIGEIDTASSTMKMYEKGSLTATPGGYRLLASRIHNYQTNAQHAGSVNEAGFNTENGGYVAFDLFVRNISGAAYYSENNILNEEPIYLTTDSQVTVGSTGVQDTGIENSVRVAFAQIGRVNGKTTDVDTITGIKCVPAQNSGVTGICRTAQIWEPNDTEHVAAAISYYDTSCRLRPVAAGQNANPTDITLASSYTANSNCATVVDGTAKETYAIGRVIDVADRVDVYDGAGYNGYTETTRDLYTDSEPLYAFDYFTDTERDLEGVNRPTFMTLAPNSITKMRVYLWIEGQDIDNYDFASIGKQINVEFGFTKERFTEYEIQGNNGATMPTGDTTKPVISGVPATLALTTSQVATFNPLSGVTASDVGYETTEPTCTTNGGTWDSSESECGYDLTTKIQVTNPVTATAGTYIVRYLVSDWQGNYAEAFTTVTVTE